MLQEVVVKSRRWSGAAGKGIKLEAGIKQEDRLVKQEDGLVGQEDTSLIKIKEDFRLIKQEHIKQEPLE
jgi:hypothetical protein